MNLASTQMTKRKIPGKTVYDVTAGPEMIKLQMSGHQIHAFQAVNTVGGN
jgi:hypothetical protein